VSLVAIPDVAVSTLFGIFDVMNFFARARQLPDGAAPFRVEIAGEAVGPLDLASGVPVNVQRAIETIETSDIVIVPSVVLGPDGWTKGRYPRLIEWLRRMHDQGAVLCSACSGIFSAGRDRALRWPGRHRALQLRPGVHGRLSDRPGSPGSGAHHLRRAGRAGEFGRIGDVA
jgi:transcriptional regulator GlxA family with amidase domain